MWFVEWFEIMLILFMWLFDWMESYGWIECMVNDDDCCVFVIWLIDKLCEIFL